MKPDEGAVWVKPPNRSFFQPRRQHFSQCFSDQSCSTREGAAGIHRDTDRLGAQTFVYQWDEGKRTILQFTEGIKLRSDRQIRATNENLLEKL